MHVAILCVIMDPLAEHRDLLVQSKPQYNRSIEVSFCSGESIGDQIKVMENWEGKKNYFF